MKRVLHHLHIMKIGDQMKYMFKRVNRVLSILLLTILLMILHYHLY